MSMADLQRMAAHHNSLPGAHITIYPGNSRRQVVDIYRDGECLLQTLEMNTAIHVVASLINAKDQDLRKEADRVAQLSTKDRAMFLYEENLRIHNEDNSAFYISRNLDCLARCTEPNEEIPLEQLYRLAERLYHGSGFTQPVLNEERLDAVRTLLENGMSEERDACLGDLTPEQTLDFLLTCDDRSFAYAVEETAASNQEKYAPEPADREDQAAFENAMKTFRAAQEKPALDAQISGAAERTSEPLKTPAKTPDREI